MKNIAAIAAVLAGVLLAACGQDDEPASKEPTAPPLTKAQLIKQADAICRRGTRDLDATLDQLPKNPTRAQWRTYVEGTLVPELEDQLADLRALRPPRADVPRIDRMLDEWTEALDKVKDDPVKESLRFDALVKDGNRIATKYGFKVCNK